MRKVFHNDNKYQLFDFLDNLREFPLECRFNRGGEEHIAFIMVTRYNDDDTEPEYQLYSTEDSGLPLCHSTLHYNDYSLSNRWYICNDDDIADLFNNAFGDGIELIFLLPEIKTDSRMKVIK